MSHQNTLQPAPITRPALQLHAPYLLVLIVLTTLLFGLPSLLVPFGRDQAEYATIADAWLRGEVIYRDVFNVKPPMTHLVHALALHLFGHTMLAIRLLDLFWQAATALCIFAIGTRMSGRRAVGFLASLLYVGVYFGFLSYWNQAQTDGFLTLGIALAVYLFYATVERPRLLLCGLAGMAIGGATLFKYPIGVLVVLLASLLLARQRRRGVWPALALIAGFALPVLLCGVLLAAQGSLGDFLWIQLTYIPGYASRTSGVGNEPIPLVSLVAFLLLLPPFGLGNLGALLSMARANRLGRWQAIAPIALWWLAALIHLIVQNKYYAYHALPLLAPQALLLADALVGLVPQSVSGQRRTRIIAGGAPLALAAIVATPVLATFGALAGGQTRWEAIYASPRYSEANGDTSVQANLAVASYLVQHTAATDTLFIWGFEPSIYFLTERQPATRFIYNFPLYGAFPAPKLREAFYQELERAMPRYILVVKRDAMPQVTGSSDDSAAAFARDHWLSSFVATHYDLETVIEDFTLYRRRGA